MTSGFRAFEPQGGNVKIELKAFREGERYYIDDPTNGFSKADNELVEGIPEMIEALTFTKVTFTKVASTKADRFAITAGDEAFPGAVRLVLGNPDIGGGVTYTLSHGGEVIEGWLCKVFWHYFAKAPKKLFVLIKAE